MGFHPSAADDPYESFPLLDSEAGGDSHVD